MQHFGILFFSAIKVALCDKIQAEIEEIKDAIAEQSGISRAPSMFSFSIPFHLNCHLYYLIRLVVT